MATRKKSSSRKKTKPSKKTPIRKKNNSKPKIAAKVKTRKIIAKKSVKSAVRTKPKLLKARKTSQKKSPGVLKKQLNPNLVRSIESYGAYVVAKHGFVKLGPYLHIDRFVDFKHLHEIPYIERGSEKLTLILFAKDANERSFSFAIRPIQTTIDIREITPDIKPLADPDRYEVTLNTPLTDGHMLHIESGHFYDGRLSVIMLGNTQAELEKYFSDKSLDDASYVRAYLEDALQAFPENVRSGCRNTSEENLRKKIKRAVKDFRKTSPPLFV